MTARHTTTTCVKDVKTWIKETLKIFQGTSLQFDDFMKNYVCDTKKAPFSALMCFHRKIASN